MTSIFSRGRVFLAILFLLWACASGGGEPVEIFPSPNMTAIDSGPPDTGPAQDTGPAAPADTGAPGWPWNIALDSGPRDAGSAGPVDTGPAEPQGTCGNNIIEGVEQCDGVDLGGERCVTLGFGEGLLTCDPETCTYDTDMCNRNQQDAGSYGAGGGTSAGSPAPPANGAAGSGAQAGAGT